jgi:26S proteasome regulatory subunit N12
MTLQDSFTLCDQLRKEFQSQEIPKAIKTLTSLKLNLAKLNLYFPTQNQKEVLLSREVLEIGALISVKEVKIEEFERFIIQLKPFYSVDFVPESPRKFMLLGLNLLCLLSQGKMSEFHTELEAIGSKQLKNVYIDHPVLIEQALMEGSYSKIWNQKTNVPAKEYSLFMDILSRTIRYPKR